MSAIDPHIFRAYDIRGKAGTQLTEDVCYQAGRAFGSIVREKYAMESPVVVVGRDARTHGPGFEKRLIDGLIESGCRVMHIGQTPSPVNYFTLCDQKADASAQITASHNPKDDNGIKLQIRGGESFSGEDLQVLRKRIEAGSFLSGKGSVKEYDAVTPYLKRLKNMFGSIGEGMKVVVDSGNGVAGPVYVKGLEQTGAEVIGMYIEPDGEFPNHPADPSKWTTLKELQEKVKETGAACGFGFDGDGDRVGLVDEKGNICTADQVLLLLAEDHLQKFPGAPVIFTVSNSGILQTEIAKWGGKPFMSKVGHSFVEHAMTEQKALLGGEQSGHFFCGEDYYSYDDALVAALHIVRILAKPQVEHLLPSAQNSEKLGSGHSARGGQSVSQMISRFPKVYTAPEKRPHCPDNRKADIVAEVTAFFKKEYPVNDLDGARIDFGDGAWAGIRYSNTSPCLSICTEARSPEKLKEVEEKVYGHLKMYPEIEL